MSDPIQGPSSGDSCVSSQLQGPAGPATAFAAFTEELDLWWVRGPVSHHAGGRVLAMRCEPGLGGRLLEVYDDTSGDALELGANHGVGAGEAPGVA